MTPYTVTCDYFATGEGRTISIWMGFADGEKEARTMFKTSVYGGDYYVLGAEVIKGFAFDDRIAKILVTDGVRSQLSDENCNRFFSAQLHFNYS